MELDRLLALYDADVRARPAARPGRKVVREDGIVRLEGSFNFICWWAPGTNQGCVDRQATIFRARGETLLWRVHDHDLPKTLPELLARAGFQASPPGTLMFFDLAQTLPAASSAGAEVRRVTDAAGLNDFVTASNQAFGDTQASDRRDGYAGHLASPHLTLFVAYVAGAPVASARLETAPGQAFGQLYGGGVAPAHRGLGVYRALVDARVVAARSLGLSYLSTEARETSRPILERLGFVPAARETTWTLSPDSTGA